MKNYLVFFTTLASLLIVVSSHANTIVESQLQLYQQQGATVADPVRGEQL